MIPSGIDQEIEEHFFSFQKTLRRDTTMPPQTSLRLGKTYTTKTVTVSDGTAQKAVTVSRPGQTSISTVSQHYTFTFAFTDFYNSLSAS